jgi:D-alanyl-D-alanine endopeptidase (penicillin-binding protein 7)
MNERGALLTVLLMACIFSMNAHQFFTQFSSVSTFELAPVALAGSLPESSERNEQVLHPPTSPNVLQDISAESFYVSYEIPDARVLVQYNPYEVKSLASLTKLMTASLLLTYDIDWDALVEVLPGDIRGGAKTIVKPGDKVAVKDLWEAMLIGSDNDATAALVRYISGSEEEFVEKMNLRANELGLQQTHFVEPTGLEAGNVSTSREYAMVVRGAFKETLVRDTLSRAGAVIRVSGEERKILSTDQRIRYKDDSGDWNYITGKTGFTYAAGYTSAVLGEDNGGRQILIVALDSYSDIDRADDIGRLIEWATRQ